MSKPMQEPVSVPLGEDWPEIRESVRRICADFPGAYWRDLDRREAYPAEFVSALTDAGYLAALIPEECHNAGCYAAAAHAQMYTMGTVLRHGSPEQKAKYLPKIAAGELRLQAFGAS